MLTGTYETLYNRLSTTIPRNRLIHDDMRTLAFGTDASFYRLIPKLVVRVRDESEVIRVLRETMQLKTPITFRAAGTSLSGQAVSDSVLAMLDGWTNYTIAHDASTIALQPGIIGAHANIFLAPYEKKIGPDPASINSAMIGGIVANNSSGMCCGTAQNSYRTLKSMRIILRDGTVLDTSDPESRERFKSTHGQFLARIDQLATRVKGNTPLAERIRRKYKMKNTMGYSLNALVDFDDPFEIVQHLMVGSEGTLAFIAEVTLNTVPELRHKASTLMLFPDTDTACRAVIILKGCRVEAVELMDRASLRAVENKSGMPPFLKSLDEQAASLLVETRGLNAVGLNQQISEITEAIEGLKKIHPVEFTSVPAEFGKLWDIRKGLFPAVGAMRKTGTTVIIEDVAFPVPSLAEATRNLQEMFIRHGYNDAIIFGHALEGNLHFTFKQDFNSAAEVRQYKQFMDDLTNMVIRKYDGALKAEHGTGRNMAPFVEFEWGSEAYALMNEIKNIFDPDHLLNPGVIINRDPLAHLKNLKPLPPADEIIDKCIECGFCEVQCPSRNLTFTPRQRIVVYREIARLRASGENPLRRRTLEEEYQYFGDDTCATDGMCATTCPVGINTGNLVKALRARNTSPLAQSVAWFISRHMAGTTAVMRGVLNLVDAIHGTLGTRAMESIAGSLRGISGNRIPLWNEHMPKGTPFLTPKPPESSNPLKVVYFPSCINRTMGMSKDHDGKVSVVEKTDALLRKAGFDVMYPDHLNSLCCGMSFASKGFKDQAETKSDELKSALLKATQNGHFPILSDTSPCTLHAKENFNGQLKIFEPIEFILQFLADKLDFHKLEETITIHNTCSGRKMGLDASFTKLANMCAKNVVVPYDVGCCGWAGDRGFTYPELNASALESLAARIPDNCSHGYSTSRTCEIGLSLHGGIPYQSVVYLVDKCTTPKSTVSEMKQ